MQMATIQAVAPSIGDREAAKMWDAQLDHSILPASPGNLYNVDQDDPGRDGPFSSRKNDRAKNLLPAGLGILSRLLSLQHLFSV